MTAVALRPWVALKLSFVLLYIADSKSICPSPTAIGEWGSIPSDPTKVFLYHNTCVSFTPQTATQVCGIYGGEPASIKNNDTQTDLASCVITAQPTGGCDGMWVGVGGNSTTKSPPNITWWDASPFDPDHDLMWHPLDPNGNLGEQPMVLVYWDTAHLADAAIGDLYAVLCQKATESPTSTPTSAPTLIPSNAPSSAPTTAPSLSPSNAPTHSPSLPPTLYPSYSPTLAPTQPPTLAPSYLPTFSPSNAPTHPPTNAPSNAPTASPTACVDFSPFYNSSDGHDDTIENIDSAKHTNSSYPANRTVDTYITTTAKGYFEETIHCNRNHPDICFIGCYGAGACAATHVRPNASDLNTLQIVCAQKKSCKGLTVNITEDVVVHRVNVLCLERNSCEEAWISIHSKTDSGMAVNIDCDHPHSCQDMTVDVADTRKNVEMSEVNHVFLHVSCFDDYSCNALRVHTDDSKNIEIEMNMYRWSDDIEISHQYLDDIQMHCGEPSERRYIRYPTDQLLDATEILDLAQQEYTAKMLPCQNIHVDCTGNQTDFDRECTFEYELSDNVSIAEILNEQDRPECYWMDIQTLYKTRCVGTCGEPVAYPQLYYTFDMDLVFDSSDDSNATTANTTRSLRVCDEYFGDINRTLDSLDSIDAVFDAVFDLISGPGQIIRDVIIAPVTMLRGDDLFIFCKNEETNVIPLSTALTFRSLANEKEFDDLFLDSSKFMNNSKDLLSKMFGIPVTLKYIQKEIKKSIKLIITWIIVVVVVLAALLIIGGIVWYVLWRRNKNTIWLSNPMVIGVAIGFYEKLRDCKEAEVDGCLRDLDQGTRVDLDNIYKTFGDGLNYTVYPTEEATEKKGKRRILWYKADLIAYFKQMAIELMQSAHDSLLVFVTCHGIDDSVITSDRKLLRKTEIHRLFSFHGKNRNIPRVFVYDCCSGADEKLSMTRKEWTKRSNEEDDSEEEEEEKKDGEQKQQEATIKAPDLERTESVTWARDEHNPDYKLAVIHGSTEGFQSKLDLEKGSWLITTFLKHLKVNVAKKKSGRTLAEIFLDVQEELHRKGQMMKKTFFNQTEYIKFRVNVDTDTVVIASPSTEVQLTKQ